MRARSTCVSRWPAATARACASEACCQAASACSQRSSAAAAERSSLVRGIQSRDHRGELAGKRLELTAVALDHAGELMDLSLRLLRDPCAGGGAARVHAECSVRCARPRRRLRRSAPGCAERIRLSGLIDSNPLDLRFRLAQIGDRRLHRRLAMRGGRIAHARLHVERLQAQREHFGLKFALLLLERLVAARGGGLALQVADLLVDLLAQIVQPVEIFARLGDAALGLPPPFLITRDARGLLEKRAQVVRPRLDHARNHALLDDGVAARAQAGAEEQLRDVLAPAPWSPLMK